MIEKIPFGRTGHLSSRVLFGAAAFFKGTQADVDRTLNLLLRYGINHIDTAASYGDSELWLAPWMERYRSEFFLASKTGERTYKGASAEIERSLNRLCVDQIDLLQLHNLVDPDEWATALGPDGALQAAIEARDKGYIRFIGVTGHGINVAARHRQSLERFPFASVLLPYNHPMMELEGYSADFNALYDICQERNVAIQTIKSIAKGRWGDQPRRRTTWYEPLEDPTDIERAVHWVLRRPNVFLNSTGDVNLLPLVLEAAASFSQLTPEELAMSSLPDAQMEPLFVNSDAI